ncbi:MAG: metal-sensitive transcriptional regulator [Firmicutes bacterium]|nr:metal-sensitive transcriptional regulator [Bacillota bacterium]
MCGRGLAVRGLTHCDQPGPAGDVRALANEYRQQDKQELLERLKRIEGQIRGISRMIEEDQYCVDVLVQVAAARAALNKVGLKLFEDHTRGCVARALRSKEGGGEVIDELIDVLHRYIK